VTAAQHEPDDGMDFTTSGRRKITDADRIHFTIDGEPMSMLRPKLTVATTAVQLIDAEIDRPTLELSATSSRHPAPSPTMSTPAGVGRAARCWRSGCPTPRTASTWST
jgi:hypothetical protein